MTLSRFNQQPPGICIKCNRLQPRIEPVAKDLNQRAVPSDHVADNGCSCPKLLGVTAMKTEATLHVSLKLSSIDIIACSTSCLEKFALNLFLRSCMFYICIVIKHFFFFILLD